MRPKEYYVGFWDLLMDEQGVSAPAGGWVPKEGPELVLMETNYNVGDVIVGEIVED